MFRRSSVWCVLLALAVVAPQAHAAAGSWMIALHGGGALPTGDFGDKDQLDAGAGLMLGGSIDYMMNEMFAIGVDGSWNRNAHGLEGETVDESGTDFTLDEAKFTTVQFGAHAKYMFPTGASAFHPYGLVG